MRRRWLRLAVVLVSLGVTLVLSEAAFRGLAPTCGISLDRVRAAREFLLSGNGVYEPHPYTDYRRRLSPEQLGQLGRDETRRGTPHADGRRILCLGASTTESGNSLGHVGSYPHYLELLIEGRLGLECDVLQGAVAGWTTAESLVAWLLDYSDFAPDLVLIHHAANDHWPMNATAFRPDYSHWRVPLELPHATTLERPLLRASLLYSFLRVGGSTTDVMAASTRAGGLSQQPESGVEPASVFRRNLRSLGQDAVRRGARVGLLTMPLRPTSQGGDPGLRARVAANNAVTRQLALDEGWYLVDLERLFGERFPEGELVANFLDAVHVTPLGNLAKAELILEALEREWPALAEGAR